jgi:putative hydrolase of the HAD superfamily
MKLVFDFGGVLFRWEPQAFLARLLPQHAATEADAIALKEVFFQGYGGDWGDFDRGTVEPDVLAERIAARTGLHPEETRRVIAGVPAELQPIADTVALLRRLHAQGRALYYLSNMPAPFAQHLEDSHDFIALFRHGLFSSRVQLCKPEPAIFEMAQRSFEAEPEQILFIGDYASNIVAARAAGWQAIHFTSPAQCEAELVERGLL